MNNDYAAQRIKYLAITATILREYARGDGITFPEYGICSNLEERLRTMEDGPSRDIKCEIERRLKDVYVTWPLYSGSRAYPVPGGEERYELNMLKWTREYGELRKQLAAFLADEFERIAKELEALHDS